MRMRCAYHVCINNVIKPRRRFCSDNCKLKFFVDKRRKNIKKMSLEYKGGVCENCGYNKCETALVFHHKESDGKDFGVASKGYTRSWDKVRKELDKCVLLCSNCHAEVHALGSFPERSGLKNRVNSVKGKSTQHRANPQRVLSFEAGVETRE